MGWQPWCEPCVADAFDYWHVTESSVGMAAAELERVCNRAEVVWQGTALCVLHLHRALS